MLLSFQGQNVYLKQRNQQWDAKLISLGTYNQCTKYEARLDQALADGEDIDTDNVLDLAPMTLGSSLKRVQQRQPSRHSSDDELTVSAQEKIRAPITPTDVSDEEEASAKKRSRPAASTPSSVKHAEEMRRFGQLCDQVGSENTPRPAAAESATSNKALLIGKFS